MKLSIVIPTYNRAALIGRALESIAHASSAQLQDTLEVLVMDNGTDATAPVVDSFRKKYPALAVRYAHDSVAGVNRARNKGARAASAEWIAFLDSDDAYVPHGPDILLATLEHVPEDVGVVGFMTMREVRGVMEPRGYDVGGSWQTHQPSYAEVVMKEKIVGDIHYCIRKSIFQNGIGFPEDIQSFESYFFALLAKRGVKFLYINKILDLRYTDGFTHIGSYKKWPLQYGRYFAKFAHDFSDVLSKHPSRLRYLYRSAGTSYLRAGDVRGVWWLARYVYRLFVDKILSFTP